MSRKELVNLDPTDSKKAVNYKKIDIGFAAEKEQSALAKAKKSAACCKSWTSGKLYMHF